MGATIEDILRDLEASVAWLRQDCIEAHERLGKIRENINDISVKVELLKFAIKKSVTVEIGKQYDVEEK